MTVENIPGWFSDTYPWMNSLTRMLEYYLLISKNLYHLKKYNNSAFLELARWRAFLTKWACLSVLVWARKHLKETLLSQNDDNRFSESLMDEGQTSSIFTPPLLRVNFTSLCMCHGNINMFVQTQKDNNKKSFSEAYGQVCSSPSLSRMARYL